MIYDWSPGFTHQYFGSSLDYAGGVSSSSGFSDALLDEKNKLGLGVGL